jgi:histidinol dehydrogenase
LNPIPPFRILSSADRREVEPLLRRDRAIDPAVMRRVERIVADVRRRGDAALLAYARRLDGLRGAAEVTDRALAVARDAVPAAVRRSLAIAGRHIAIVARRQLPVSSRIRVAAGVVVEQRVVPLRRVGCYVPGGRYPLPSSLLMAAVPARVAGVREVVVVCPRPAPVVLHAARVSRVDRVFGVGGAHAIAALAYGTETIPRVDKIVGPGNAYVAAAKALVSADCAIDMHAGPTEILILSRRGNPEWIAADLLAQAEHDPDARGLLVTPSRTLAERVAAAVARRLPSSGPAAESIARHGAAIVTRTYAEALAVANRVAPEHLVVDDEEAARGVEAAGAVFVGPYSAQASGDYATGSNHVLPTAGAARFRGGLSAADFVRVMSVQRVTRAGLRSLAPAVTALARAEGLEAHAASIEVRLA